MEKSGTVYIMTNVLKSVLCTGVTSNLIRRVHEHKQKVNPQSFTAQYNVVHLVYYQNFPSIQEAIAEEKRIKGGNRKQKCRLINSINPHWEDLWDTDVSMW